MSAAATADRVAFGCVAEPTPAFYRQTLRLVRSIRWFGGSLAEADVFVCFVGDVASEQRAELEELGAQVRLVEPFNPLNRFSNKVRFLELPELARYETAVLLDCDMAIVQDPAPYLAQPALQLMIADLPTVPSARLAQLCTHFGLAAPEPRYRTTCSQEPTIWYCNTGVTIMPTAWIARLLPAWKAYILELCAVPSLLDPPYSHCNQAAMTLTYVADPLPFVELPVAMNFPLHQTGRRPTPAMLREDPVVLHYHDRVDDDGLLLPAPYPLAQARIEQLNERLRQQGKATQRLQGDAAGAAGRGAQLPRSVAHRPVRSAPWPGAAAAVLPSGGRRPVAARLVRRARPGRRVVVCVTGMHRSGTSLVAQILHRCGVYLGPPAALAEPSPDNQDGYWEHPEFHAINEELLEHFGGGWDLAPRLPPGWVDLPELEPLRRRAGVLIGRMARRRLWGWKDPRCALTLPFWRRLIPDLKVVVCVRHPAEVAQSLRRRGMSSLAFGLRLWDTYNEQLATAAPEEQIVTHYDAYFADTVAETRRVLGWLGIARPRALVERAGRAASGELRHHRSASADTLPDPLPAAVLARYRRLCEAAGVADDTLPDDAALADAPEPIEPAAAAERLSAALLRRCESSLAAARTELAVLEAVLAAREADVAFLRPALPARDAEIAGLGRELDAAHQVLAARDAEITGLGRELDATRQVLAARDAEIVGFGRELDATRQVLAARDAEIAGLAGAAEAQRAQPQTAGEPAAAPLDHAAPTRWQDIPGWFQWRSAQEEAAEHFPDGSRFVEVGTYLGRSLCSLGEVVAQSGKSIAVIGVDTCRGSGPEGPRQKDYHGAVVAQHGGTFAGALHKHVVDCGYGDAVTLIVTDSLSAAGLFADGSVEWVHLDARHDYDSLTADIRAWLPKLRPGGWLSGDDYDPVKWPEVVRAVGDVLPGAQEWSAQQWRWIVA